MALPAVKFSATSLAAALAQTVVPTQSGGEGGFLKFDGKQGGWSFGRDGEAVDDEILLINTTSLGHGWVLWVDGQPKEKRIVRFNEPMPEPMDPVPIKVKKNGKMVDDMAEPMEMRIVQAAFMDNQEGATFETSSYGGRAAVDSLLAQIKQKAVQGSAYLFPAVKLVQTSYYNKTYKTDIFNPAFEVVSWHDQDGNPEVEVDLIIDENEPEQAPEQAKAPAAKTQRKQRNAPAAAAPEPEPEVEDPVATDVPPAAAPQRRRRTVNPA